MDVMLKRILLAGLFANMVVLVQGCTCAAGTFEERYASTHTVVQAKVISVVTSPTPKPSPCLTFPCLTVIPDQPVMYKLQLLGILKGCGPQNKVFYANSNLRPGFCGFGLARGEIYMLNLYMELPVPGQDKISFNVNSCQGNMAFSSLSSEEVHFLVQSSSKPENQCFQPPFP